MTWLPLSLALSSVLSLKLFDRHREQSVGRRPAASALSSYVPVSNYAKCQLKLQFTPTVRVCVFNLITAISKRHRTC